MICIDPAIKQTCSSCILDFSNSFILALSSCRLLFRVSSFSSKSTTAFSFSITYKQETYADKTTYVSYYYMYTWDLIEIQFPQTIQKSNYHLNLIVLCSSFCNEMSLRVLPFPLNKILIHHGLPLSILSVCPSQFFQHLHVYSWIMVQ